MMIRMCKVARTFSTRPFSQYSTRGPPWSVIFFGSDNFSLSSLKMLHQELLTGENIGSLSIVCTCLKCPVAQYSVKNKFKVLIWKQEEDEIKKQNADIGLVVSFGHLIPQRIISAFPLGMINVHASLLPKWRGAAPIIHSVLNGEKETGVSVMKIRPHRFDCGEIISSAIISIGPDESALSVTNRLADVGALELQNCLSNLLPSLEKAKPQPDTDISYAPKVDESFSSVAWDQMSAAEVYRRHLALGFVHPLHADWQGEPIKILDCSPLNSNLTNSAPGDITFSKKLKQLEVTCDRDSVLAVRQLKLTGRKPLTAMDFVNGFLKRVPKLSWKFGNGLNKS